MIRQFSAGGLCALAVSFSVLAFTQQAVAQSMSSERQIEQEVRSWISIDVSARQNSLLSQVFQCRFFSVTPSLETPSGEGTAFGDYLFIESEGLIGALEQPFTTQPLPQLQACIKPGMLINDETQAGLLLDALQVLYPEDSRFEAPIRIIEKSTNGWHLINGSFFEKRSGYAVELNDDGTVAQLTRSLEL
ncbi:MAG: hypothetical protein OIF55_14910 [Amphritea sp.]|nr:hypothetical protein [Amphritea sp.]